MQIFVFRKTWFSHLQLETRQTDSSETRCYFVLVVGVKQVDRDDVLVGLYVCFPNLLGNWIYLDETFT